MGYLMPDGALHICGRQDLQVKVRGNFTTTVSSNVNHVRSGLLTPATADCIQMQSACSMHMNDLCTD